MAVSLLHKGTPANMHDHAHCTSAFMLNWLLASRAVENTDEAAT